MTEPAGKVETLSVRLKSIRLDLCSMINRLNREHYSDAANLAQQVLVGLDALAEKLAEDGASDWVCIHE